MRVDLYDRPGTYLVDHPNARHAIAKRVACLVSVAALAAPAAASAVSDPGGIGHYPRVNPGWVGHYGPQATRGVEAI